MPQIKGWERVSDIPRYNLWRNNYKDVSLLLEPSPNPHTPEIWDKWELFFQKEGNKIGSRVFDTKEQGMKEAIGFMKRNPRG